MRVIILISLIFIAHPPHIWAAEVGDVIFSELMWMGDFASPDNEWIELRNLTSEAIDLTGWDITVFNSARQQEELMLRIPAGMILPASGFFLIANSSEADSNIAVPPDLIDERVSLPDATLQLKLYDGRWNVEGKLIDLADDRRGDPIAGLQIEARKSMVRNDPPGPGDQFGNWHTADVSIGWDEGATECGTPTQASSSFAPELEVSPLTLGFQLPQAEQTITIRNAAGGQLQWEVFDAPAWLSVIPTTGTTARGRSTPVDVAVLTENLPVGTHQGGFQIRNLTDSSQVSAVAISVNHPPTLQPVTDQIVKVGDPIDLKISAADSDGDALVFTADTLPEGSTLDAQTGSFTWTPTRAQEIAVEFRVDDNHGGVVNGAIAIQVVLLPPYLVGFALLSAGTQTTDNPSKGVTYQFAVENRGTMADVIQLSVVAAEDNPPFPLTVSLQPPSLALPPGDQGETILSVRSDVGATSGVYQFSVTATSQGDAEQAATIDVTTILQERPILEIKPIFDEEQTNYTLQLQNPTDLPLNWEFRSPSWIQIFPLSGVIPAKSTVRLDAAIQFTDLPPQTHEGMLEFLFVHNGANSPDGKQTIPVYVNRKPIITAPLSVSHTTDVPLEIPIQVADPDRDAATLSAMDLPVGAALTQTQVEPGMELPLMTSLRWEAPVAGNYTVFLQATDSLGAAAEQAIELEIVLKTRWVVALQPNQPNLLHIPVSDPRFPVVSRLFDHLRPNVEQILVHDSVNQTFRAYTNLSAPGMADDLPLAPYTGVIVFLKAGRPTQQVTFEGTPYTDISVPIIGSESNGDGINLIGLPVKDPRFETLGDLKTHYPQIMKIIGQNAVGELVSTESADLPVVGGQAFIVFSETRIQLTLSGTPWTQNE